MLESEPEAAEKKLGPYEQFKENIRLALADPEERARRDAEMNDPNYVPRNVAWREDSDPFGMDWTWADPSGQLGQ